MAVVFIEDNEARSVMETLSGLLGAMRVLFRGDRLSFAQAVAPYFAGYDAFRWSRCVMPVARHLVGRDASCSGERRVHYPSGRRVLCASSWPRSRRSERLRPSAARQIQWPERCYRPSGECFLRRACYSLRAWCWRPVCCQSRACRSPRERPF